MKLTKSAIDIIDSHLDSDDTTDIIIRKVKGRVKVHIGEVALTIREEVGRTRQDITGVSDDAIDSEDKLNRLRIEGII